MKFASNSERRAYWTVVMETYSAAEIEEALRLMPPDTSRVLHLHYNMKYPLKDIEKIMNRSRTTVHNHHARGIIRLYKYFNPDWWKDK
jgi:DNA-directed RNA polymerase specialized sigma24 family protein